MKNLAAAALLTLTFTACAGGPPKPKYIEEKNEAKFATTKEVPQKPADVKLAAHAVLDQLTMASMPQASDTVQSDDDNIRTGWIYFPASRDKYVDFDYNGTVRRKQLAVRRVFQYTVTPSLAGSTVVMQVKEEVEKIDMKTGEQTGWKSVDPDTAMFDMMYRKLKEQLSKQ
jgi:hypothetical protein